MILKVTKKWWKMNYKHINYMFIIQKGTIKCNEIIEKLFESLLVSFWGWIHSPFLNCVTAKACMSVADYSEPSVLRLRIVQPYVPLRWNFKRERVCNRHTGLRRRNTIQKKGRRQKRENTYGIFLCLRV